MGRTHIGRRRALSLLGSAGAAFTIGCGDSPTSPTPTTTTPPGGSSTGGTTVSTNSTCAVTPSETAGPFPSLTDMLRSDIREDRAGIPLTLTIKVVNTNSACAGVANAAVEIWHCDIAGNYSQYGAVAQQTFLRGIQISNSNGEVVFTTIYPGWYQGRATHIHAEVSVNGRSVKVTQIAFPENVNNAVHMVGPYASKGVNPTSNASDGIFADSLAAELVTPVGSTASGYTAAFQIGVAL